MSEPREPDDRGETAVDWRGQWKQAADGTWYQGSEPPRDEPSRDEASDATSTGRGAEQAEPSAPDTAVKQARHSREDKPEAPPPPPRDPAKPEEEPKPGKHARKHGGGTTTTGKQVPTKQTKGRSRWATVGFLVVAGMLVAGLVHAVLSTGSRTPLNNNSGGNAESSELPSTTPASKRPILLGAGSSLTSPPTITIDPGMVRQGGRVAITGIGFDPGALVDMRFTPQDSTQAFPVPAAVVAPDGSFTSAFTMPPLPNANGGTILAAQHGPVKKTARDDVEIQAGAGTARLSALWGRPGNTVDVTADGFQPGENVDAYSGRIGGPPVETLKPNEHGGLLRAPLRVGVAPVGNASLILVGEQSKTTATASYSMVSLYPSAGIQPYSVQPGEPFGVGGIGFMAGEPVLVYINKSSGPPITVLKADQRGMVGVGGLIAPYQLQGRQTLELIGAESRTTAMTGFQTMPYSPAAQPSTWGGMPGTSMSFYARGFAPNEVVLVYRDLGPRRPQELVTAFRVNSRGTAIGGHYTIPANTNGRLSLHLVGRESQATAYASLAVQGAPGVAVPPTPKYVLPPDLATDPPLPGTPSGPR
jgi:hypothetical protein